MAGVSIEPKDKERFTKRSKVNVFYIGVKHYKAHGGFPPPTVIKTMVVPTPPLGQNVTLDEVYADDLIRKTVFNGKPIYMLESMGGAELAKMIRDSIERGEDPAQIDGEAFILESQVKKMSEDEFVAMAEKLGYTISRLKAEPEPPAKKSDPKKDNNEEKGGK